MTFSHGVWIVFASIIAAFSGVYFFITTAAQNLLRSVRFWAITLCAGILIAATGLLAALFDIESSGEILFFVLQGIFLLFGIIYNVMLKKEIFGELSNPEISHPLILLMTVALGAACFIWLFDKFDPNHLAHIFVMSVFTFFLPYFIFRFTFLVLSIPPEVYKIWYFDNNAEDPEPDSEALKSLFLFDIEFKKNLNKDNHLIASPSIKAPTTWVFGVWFRSFINLYNYRNENDPLEYLDSEGRPYGWAFFVKPTRWYEDKKFIDFDLTIKENKIPDKSVIVANRVVVQD